MKLTTILLIIALVFVSATGRGQITLKEKNAPLEKVLAAIEKQTKYVFLYDPDDLKMVTITINVKNATLQETLEKCFKGLAIEFTVVGNNVLLKKNRPGNVNEIAITDVRFTGKVIDENGKPMSAVTVINKRENRAAETDSTGVFTIAATKGDILGFSFVGYTGKKITIGDQRYINIRLEPNLSGPEQVVVIGYGSSKMKDLTGAVSVADVQDMGEVPYNTFDNAVAGKAAGVDVTKTDGTPGGMARIRIRGTTSLLGGNDPLYVIDGVPVQVRSNFIDPGFKVASPAADLSGASTLLNGAALSASFVNGLNSLGGLNPADIESITVLKDASSTAIYGSKAANGVVIITTRTGKTNSPTQVAADYRTTITTLYRSLKLLNASQYRTLLTEAAQNAFNTANPQGNPVQPSTIAVLDSPAYFGAANTNWIKDVTHTVVSHSVGLSVSGGGPASKYFSSISYSNTPGVVNGTDFRRIAGKLNVETQISSKLKFSTNLLLGYTDQDIGDGAYAQALFARPDWTPRDATGNYTDFGPQAIINQDFLNPVALLTATNNAKTTSLLGSVSGTYAILKDLRFRSTVSLNMQNYNQRNFLPSYIDIAGPQGNLANPGGIGSNANSRFADWFLENALTYTKQFNKHAVNAVIGQSYETTKYSYFRATATGYPNNTTLTGLSSADSVIGVAGDEPGSPQSYLLSFYARINYGYLDKYLFTFTGRADGSSKFGPDNKYGYFPSGAIAWRMSRENFLKNVGWINDLKLRGSYGITGNQNIGDQIYRTLYSPVTYNGASALIPTQLGNQGIKWESTREADIGLDLSLLSDRLNATFDYYNRQTDDALFSLPVAASSSYTNLLENAVGLRNRGFEASVGGEIIRGRGFTWTASINVTWNNSIVTRLDSRANPAQIVSLSGLESVSTLTNGLAGNTTLIQGQPLGLITGNYITGIIKTQAQLQAYSMHLGIFAPYYDPQIGSPMYKLDTSTASLGFEGPLEGATIGNGSPKYFGGSTQEFTYKRFSLQCYFTFTHGGHLLWVEHIATKEFFGTANANILMFNRYTPANTNSNEPALNLSDQGEVTNLDVFSSSYFKLRSLTLNYRFNVKKMSISNARIFISATNVFTLTKYPGSDPETSDDPYSPNGGYIDAGNYPATRTFSLGLRTTF
jgi:TonB-linked SusC/RagA family outer membrane protein